MALYNNLVAFEEAKSNLERACPNFSKTEDGKNFIKETAMFLAEEELYTKGEIKTILRYIANKYGVKITFDDWN